MNSLEHGVLLLLQILTYSLLLQQLHKRRLLMLKRKSARNRRIWSRKWLMRRDEGRGMANMVLKELKFEDPNSFKNFTRMTANTFEDLLLMLGSSIERKNTILRECISTKTRLLVTLRFLATGETYQSLSYSFRVSVPSLSILIPETIEVIYASLQGEYLKTPRTAEEWKRVAFGFNNLWNFPMCLGALDGKHIAFRAKKTDGSYYYNYKGFNSIVLLALVDAEYNFLYVDVGCNGRVSDGGVYRNSSFSTAVERNSLNFPEDDFLPSTTLKVPYVIVADDAFKSSARIIKPWGQRSSKTKKIFNYRLSRARRVVENSFGILSNRFKILQKDINLSVDKVQSITLACCALHNFIKRKDGKRYLAGIDYENTTLVTRTPGEWRKNVFMTNLQRNRSNRSSDDSIIVRNSFTTYFNGCGSVPWQEEAVIKFNF